MHGETYADPYTKGASTSAQRETQLSAIETGIVGQQRRLTSLIMRLQEFADNTFGAIPTPDSIIRDEAAQVPGAVMRLAQVVDDTPMLLNRLEEQIDRFANLG